MSFEQELQNLLNLHPEVEEVKVRYKKSVSLKPKEGAFVNVKNPALPQQTPIISLSDTEKVAQMIKNGEL